MGNSLKMADKQRILALLELGWSYRRIQRETGVRRETVARYDPKKVSKPANVPTGPVANAAIEERDVRAYRLLQGMISFTRKYPKEQVDWACGVALEGRLFRHKHLRRLVEQAARRAPAQLPLIQTHEIIRELSEYAKEVNV